MNQGYDECIMIIAEWKKFREEVASGHVKDFANWLLSENETVLETQGHERFILDRASEMEEQIVLPDLANRGLIGHLLARMNLFVKNYAKQPFQEIGFVNLEEFRLLQIVDRVEDINKSQLSNESLMEFSTVADILKRLIKQGLIEQVRDKSDKRATLLQTTVKGKEMLNTSYKTLANLQPNVAGDLSLKEQQTLIHLLLRLNSFHTDYFEHHFLKKTKKK